MMAKVLRLHSCTGPDGLQLDDVPLATPGAGEVRIRVHAFALNWGDMDLMRGDYTFRLDSLPARVGSECVGTVDAVGPDVATDIIGKRVCSIPYFYGDNGVNGEFAIVPRRFVTLAPEDLGDDEACSIWMQYLTAYFPLAEIGKLAAGSRILIVAATGSAGLGALEIASCLGATSVCTTRFDRNRSLLKKAGAAEVIATDKEDLGARLAHITQDGGIDLVYDPIGGKIVDIYADYLAQNSNVVIYGGISGEPTVLPELALTRANCAVRLYSMMNYTADDVMRQRGVSFVLEHLARNELHPQVDRGFALEDFAEAFRYMQSSRQQHGKIVVRIE